MKRTFLAATAFACLLSNGAAHAANCALKQVASLPMIGDVTTAVVVDVGVAGKRLRFLVDTGGLYSEIVQAAADQLKLEPHLIRNGLEVYGVTGRVGEYYVNASDVTLGALHLDKLPMLVGKEKLSDGIDGILGPDVLARFDLDFDFASKKLNLVARDHCPGQVVYWTKSAYAAADFDLRGAHIVLPVTLDEHAFQALLDTGSDMTRVEETAARSILGVEETSPGAKTETGQPAGSPDRFDYQFKLLSLGGLGVSNPRVVVYRDTMRAGYRQAHPGSVALSIYDDSEGLKAPDFILGMNVLSKFHVYVSYEEKKVYFTPANSN